LDFFIVPQLKAWSKRAPRKTTPKNWLKNNSIVLKKRALFLWALYLDTTQQGNPPREGGAPFDQPCQHQRKGLRGGEEEKPSGEGRQGKGVGEGETKP